MAGFADFDLATDREDKRILHWGATQQLFQVAVKIERPCARHAPPARPPALPAARGADPWRVPQVPALPARGPGGAEGGCLPPPRRPLLPAASAAAARPAHGTAVAPAQQAVVEVLEADLRGDVQDSVQLFDAAPNGGMILTVRRAACGLRASLEFAKGGQELHVQESKYSFTVRRASDSAKKRPRAQGPGGAARKAPRTAAADLATVTEEPGQLTGGAAAPLGNAKRKKSRWTADEVANLRAVSASALCLLAERRHCV